MLRTSLRLASLFVLAFASTGCPRPPPPQYVAQPEPFVPAPPAQEIALAALPPAGPNDVATPEGFRAILAPHGQWLDTPEYGQVWRPANVAPDWRPYTNGQWVMSERGFTFVAYEPWGWAPFHYGRWAYQPPWGWIWIPAYEWAPAWVAWRYGGGYLAWAPLGPASAAASYYATPTLWTAVRAGHFTAPLRPTLFIPSARIDGVLGVTYFAGVPRAQVYLSPPAPWVARVSGKPIPRVAAFVVAPRWVPRGVYRARVRISRAFRGAPVIAKPRYVRKVIRPAPKKKRPARSFY